jgi:competence ComEA-like helix-hairpin-helix protein
MGDFTRQEKVIIYFLSFVLIIGIGVDFYRKRNLKPQLGISTFKIEELNPPAQGSPAVNVNQSDIEQLLQLPGIGPKLAERIVKYRNAHGPFNQPQDLLKVDGIGTKKLADIEKLLSF